MYEDKIQKKTFGQNVLWIVLLLAALLMWVPASFAQNTYVYAQNVAGITGSGAAGAVAPGTMGSTGTIGVPGGTLGAGGNGSIVAGTGMGSEIAGTGVAVGSNPQQPGVVPQSGVGAIDSAPLSSDLGTSTNPNTITNPADSATGNVGGPIVGPPAVGGPPAIAGEPGAVGQTSPGAYGGEQATPAEPGGPTSPDTANTTTY